MGTHTLMEPALLKNTVSVYGGLTKGQAPAQCFLSVLSLKLVL